MKLSPYFSANRNKIIAVFATYGSASPYILLIAIDSYHSAPTGALCFSSESNRTHKPFTINRSEPRNFEPITNQTGTDNSEVNHSQTELGRPTIIWIELRYSNRPQTELGRFTIFSTEFEQNFGSVWPVSNEVRPALLIILKIKLLFHFLKHWRCKGCAPLLYFCRSLEWSVRLRGWRWG